MRTKVRQSASTTNHADDVDDTVDNIMADIARWQRHDAAAVVHGLVRSLHGCVRQDTPFRPWPEGLGEALDLVLAEALSLPPNGDPAERAKLEQICAVARGKSDAS